ncbi:DNA repair exonuclease [Parvularcula sp. ZS-1/3]|uniref:DNA repair exonuclease n=1 Tax=Parvularcula mediterranea TaxID=2732508 RepID=A0A7Y3RNJ7_9PROT|nr:metallophosphoesterase [Parvularcula mediterranea]NNU17371.1 DNA repair exonuclease [Parvularcula mediterranea]
MGFRFLHTADWQLGRPFARFDAELRGQLKDARLSIIETLAALAREEGVTHVLVAGDVWDQMAPSDQSLRRPLDRMRAASDLQFWLMPGNHDPAGAEGLWQRLQEMGVPENVHLLLEARPHQLEEGVFVLPAPWPTKRPGRDLSADLDRMETPEGALRIGLAHAGTEDIKENAESAMLIAPDRADRAGLRYLALGDWHGMKRAGERTFYSGTPEPDRFRNNNQGYALIVDTDQPDAPQRHATAQFRWRMAEAAFLPGDDPVQKLADIFPADAALDRTLVRLEISGVLSLSESGALTRFLEEQRARVAYLRLKDQGLSVETDARDLDELLGDGLLRNVAERLAASPESEASLALRYLDSFARS